MRHLDKYLVLIGCVVLGGCATHSLSSAKSVTTEARKPSDLADCDAQGEAREQLDNRVVVGLLDEARFHAALARLDAIQSDNAYTRYLRAHVLRQLDRRDQAHTLYQELLSSCMAGYAHHGLGLLAARKGMLDKAREHLGQARQTIPLDVRVRNDYGYVLLLTGEPEAAYAEFMTALELNGDVRQPRYNALLALVLLGRMEQARGFAERESLSAADIDRARQEARQITHDSIPFQEHESEIEEVNHEPPHNEVRRRQANARG